MTKSELVKLTSSLDGSIPASPTEDWFSPDYTDEQRRFLVHVAEGCGIECSIALAGWTYTQYERWCRAGGADWFTGSVPFMVAEDPYKSFVADLLWAKAYPEYRLIRIVMAAAERDGWLALRVLARLYPERWGAQREHAAKEVTTKAPPQVIIQLVDRPPVSEGPPPTRSELVEE